MDSKQKKYFLRNKRISTIEYYEDNLKKCHTNINMISGRVTIEGNCAEVSVMSEKLIECMQSTQRVCYLEVDQ